MIGKESLERLYGVLIYDSAGEKIGKIGTIYLDDSTGDPAFATVSTGLFGMSESFVPLQGAHLDGDDLRLEYTKDQVKDAPRVDGGRQLSPEEEDRLYEHYRLDGVDTRSGGIDTAGTAGVTGTPGTATASGPARAGIAGTADDAAVTAREERLDEKSRTEEARRARLRKHTTDGR